MVDPLSQYLRDATALRFDKARCNCMTWVADWIAFCIGRDPAAPWRGESDVDVWETAQKALAGFPAAAPPQRGDVGLVLAPDLTAAICLGRGRWAALAPQGLAVASWPVVRTWGLPHA